MSIVEHYWQGSEGPGEARCPEGSVTFGFVRTGVAALEQPDGQVHSDVNHVVFLGRNAHYRVRHVGCSCHDCAVTLHVSEAVFRKIFALSDLASPRLLPRSAGANVALNEMLTATRSGAGCSRDVARLSLELLEAISDRGTEDWKAPAIGCRTGRRPSVVERVAEILSTRFREPLCLDRLADEVGCSKFHLCRLFKRTRGITLTRYVHRLRVDEAVCRLGDGATNLSDLAFDLGFASHSHFTAVFHREVGMTPTEVRSRYWVSPQPDPTSRVRGGGSESRCSGPQAGSRGAAACGPARGESSDPG